MTHGGLDRFEINQEKNLNLKGYKKNGTVTF